MLARIHAAPNVSSLRTALQTIALTLYDLNRVWITDAVRGGLTPPRRVADCEPPWCPQPIIYRRHHGSSPAGDDRDYFDGPTMFHRGEATCIDIAAYDAAAMTVLEGVDARPLVVGDELTKLHCIVLLPRSRTDPTTGLRPGEAITRPWQ